MNGIKQDEKKIIIEALTAYSNGRNKKEVGGIIKKVKRSLAQGYNSAKFKIPFELDLRRKLKQGEADLIRRLHDKGETYSALANQFNISVSYVFLLCNQDAMQRVKEYNREHSRGRYDKKSLERRKIRMVRLGMENKLIARGSE